MIVKDELLSKLRRYFSLNLYEVKIWTGLLSRGVSTAGELSDIADVPRSRSYDVLESLEKKGFIITKIGKPIKYIAVAPDEVVERVKENMKKDAEEKVNRLEEMKSTDLINELNQLHTQGFDLVEPSELSGSLKGRHNLYNHLDLTIRKAEKSVTFLTTADGFKRKAEGLRPTLEKLKKRGVKIRFAAPINKTNKDVVENMKNIGEVRHTNMKGRFAIVDGSEVVFMVMDDSKVHPTYDVGLWASSPFFANAMENMFEHSWKNMQPVTKTK